MTDITKLSSMDPALVSAVSNTAAVNVRTERQVATDSGKSLPSEQAKEPPTEEQVDDAVHRIANFVQNVSRDLEFSVDQESGRTVMTVTDRITQEVVRQVPSEEVLEMSRIVKRITPDSARGLLLQSEA
ncbi:flagellar protein FlaG [Porticoccaceae bacterium LTM1]|nr:flagellar protein FlaG [Porticoccaceae bacterium LTM1]